MLAERRQLLLIGCVSCFLSFSFSALELLYTVYAMNILNVSASEWSQIKGMRFFWTIFIVIGLATFAGKTGQIKIAIATVLFLAMNLSMFIVWPSMFMLIVTFPLHLAFVSIMTLTLNVIVQLVPDRIQHVSNTLYRTTFTGLAIAGPLVVAVLLGFGHIRLFLLCLAVLIVTIPLFMLYPLPEAKKKGKPRPKTVKRLMVEWRVLFRNRYFLRFEIVLAFVYSSFLVNQTFGPVKLMQSLHMTDQQFSFVTTGVALTTVLFTIICGFLYKRFLNELVYLPLVLCSLGSLFMGLQNDIGITSFLFILSNALNTITFASVSIWSSKVVFPSQLGYAFALHKIVVAVLGLLFSFALSWLEQLIGMNLCLIVFGAMGFLLSIVLKLSISQPPLFERESKRVAK